MGSYILYINSPIFLNKLNKHIIVDVRIKKQLTRQINYFIYFTKQIDYQYFIHNSRCEVNG